MTVLLFFIYEMGFNRFCPSEMFWAIQRYIEMSQCFVIYALINVAAACKRCTGAGHGC